MPVKDQLFRLLSLPERDGHVARRLRNDHSGPQQFACSGKCREIPLVCNVPLVEYFPLAYLATWFSRIASTAFDHLFFPRRTLNSA